LSLNTASIIAKLNLAWALVLHLLKKILFWRKGGYPQFIENYREDRLSPLSIEDKDWMQRFSRCFNCGLCDTVCPALEKLPRERFPGPSYIVTTLARATPDFWAADLDLSLCAGCELCEQVCPNQVPIKKAIEFIVAKAHVS
jgi:succinate dehydrogenase/fumarate reductase-like Fe-S protein